MAFLVDANGAFLVDGSGAFLVDAPASVDQLAQLAALLAPPVVIPPVVVVVTTPPLHVGPVFTITPEPHRPEVEYEFDGREFTVDPWRRGAYH